jgi:hypothetical protein
MQDAMVDVLVHHAKALRRFIARMLSNWSRHYDINDFKRVCCGHICKPCQCYCANAPEQVCAPIHDLDV